MCLSQSTKAYNTHSNNLYSTILLVTQSTILELHLPQAVRPIWQSDLSHLPETLSSLGICKTKESWPSSYLIQLFCLLFLSFSVSRVIVFCAIFLKKITLDDLIQSNGLKYYLYANTIKFYIQASTFPLSLSYMKIATQYPLLEVK